MLNIILLSGGSGARLWPLSNGVRAKQFLKIFNVNGNDKESMIERTYRYFKILDNNVKITVATHINQVAQIKSQLKDMVEISEEPFRKDTFPSIVLASLLLYKKGKKEDEKIVVCPIDAYADKTFYEKILELGNEAKPNCLSLIGIKATYPSTQYGYILSDKTFKEKPDEETAKKYIKDNAYWNSGVFAFTLGYILKKSKEIFGTIDYDELYSKYENIEKISFDFKIAEKEKNIEILKYDGEWRDIGTWNSFLSNFSDKISGNAKMVNTNNTYIINELAIPILTIGIDNAIVAATPDGILVSNNKETDNIKEYIKDNRPMYEKREWGEYKVLDYQKNKDGSNSLTKQLIIYEGKHISYQIHNKRYEMWTVIDGIGEAIIEDKIIELKKGSTITIPPKTKHAVKANVDLKIIEVQLGDELTEDDIERIDHKW